MTETFEQGWAARPFKEQFPELSDAAASRLDQLNLAVIDMLMAGLITDSQADAIRKKKFPKFVSDQVSGARKRAAIAAEKGGQP
jgi:hypothetical protein